MGPTNIQTNIQRNTGTINLVPVESSPLLPPTAQNRISYGLHNRLCLFSLSGREITRMPLEGGKKILKKKKKKKIRIWGGFRSGFGVGFGLGFINSIQLKANQFNWISEKIKIKIKRK